MSPGGKGRFGGRPWYGKGGGKTFAPRCSGGGAPRLRGYGGADEWVHGTGAGAGGHEHPRRDPGPSAA
eukprot:3576849-Pyramimonas_sp.AAC.1